MEEVHIVDIAGEQWDIKDLPLTQKVLLLEQHLTKSNEYPEINISTNMSGAVIVQKGITTIHLRDNYYLISGYCTVDSKKSATGTRLFSFKFENKVTLKGGTLNAAAWASPTTYVQSCAVPYNGREVEAYIVFPQSYSKAMFRFMCLAEIAE